MSSEAVDDGVLRLKAIQNFNKSRLVRSLYTRPHRVQVRIVTIMSPPSHSPPSLLPPPRTPPQEKKRMAPHRRARALQTTCSVSCPPQIRAAGGHSADARSRHRYSRVQVGSAWLAFKLHSMGLGATSSCTPAWRLSRNGKGMFAHDGQEQAIFKVDLLYRDS